MDAPDSPESASRAASPLGVVAPHAAVAISQALERATQRIVSLRDPDDTPWQGRLPESPELIANMLLFDIWRDTADTPHFRHGSERLLEHHLPNGGWARVVGQPMELNTSVLGYLALRMSGHPRHSQTMTLASDAIRARGGVSACDVVTRYYLALFGIHDYSFCPPIPPESFLLPGWMPGSWNGQSQWSMTIHLLLAMLWARRPQKTVFSDGGLSELTSGTTPRIKKSTWTGRLVELFEKWHLRPFRKSALRYIDHWIVQRIHEECGLGGSPEATILAVIALTANGHDEESPSVRSGLAFLSPLRSSNRHANEGVERERLPTSSLSPVNDTALAVRAILSATSQPDTAEVRQGIEWLLREEISKVPSVKTTAKEGGDQVTNQSGWSRTARDPDNPNVPATAMVLLALRGQFAKKPPSSLVTDDSMVAMIRANSLNLAHRQIAVLDRVAAASRRARHWIVAMQNPDGGWGHARHFQAVRPSGTPIALGLPVEDRSTPASSGRVLMALGAWEMGCGQSAVDRAVSYMREQQGEMGHWPGEHDAGVIEATWAAVLGLRSVGIHRRDATISRAADWLEAQQNPDGGWSIAPMSADRESQPLETAWAIMALVAAGRRQSPPVDRGIDYLLSHQRSDGSWRHHPDGLAGRNPLANCQNSVSAIAYPILALIACIGGPLP